MENSKNKKTYTPDYKAKLVLELLNGKEKISVIAEREDITTAQLRYWKKIFTENAYLVFTEQKAEKELIKLKKREETLNEKIANLTKSSDVLADIHSDTSVIMETLQLILTNMLLNEVDK